MLMIYRLCLLYPLFLVISLPVACKTILRTMQNVSHRLPVLHKMWNGWNICKIDYPGWFAYVWPSRWFCCILQRRKSMLVRGLLSNLWSDHWVLSLWTGVVPKSDCLPEFDCRTAGARTAARWAAAQNRLLFFGLNGHNMQIHTTVL